MRKTRLGGRKAQTMRQGAALDFQPGCSVAASSRSSWVVGSLVALAFAPSHLRAQPVFVPLAPPPSDATRSAFFSTNGVTAESILTSAAPDPESDNPLRWGPFAAHPHIDYQYINASGIRQATPGNPSNTVSTIQHLIYPGLDVQLGKQWHIAGGVSLNYYTDEALSDSVGYNAIINGAIPREDWLFGISAGFNSSDTSQIETAQQTKQDNYDLGVTAVYGARRRVSYELGLSQDISLSEGFNDSYGWSTMNWVNYTATTKTSLGLGLGGGYTILDSGSQSFSTTGTDSANEQIQGRVTWNPLQKLSVSVSGGAQIQQFFAEDEVNDSVSPIYSISAGYLPVESTSFSLSASRTVGTSIASDEHTENLIVALGFRQRLLKHFYLGVTPSYSLTDYRSNLDPDAGPNRTDEILAINVSLSTMIFKKVSVSTFFGFSDNRSDDDFYSYESRQFGFQLGYRY